MAVLRHKIVVIDSCEMSRIRLCSLLVKEGYSVFECRDVYKALRLTRQIMPDLVLLDADTKGLNSKQLISIIQGDKLSEVVIMSSKETEHIKHFLSLTTNKGFISKPIEPYDTLSIIHDILRMVHRERLKQKQKERMKNNLSGALNIEEAKGILMKKWHINEDQAYRFLRKKSMNQNQAIEVTAINIIKMEKL